MKNSAQGPGSSQFKELAEAGAFKPVIGRYYAIEQIVEAHAYVDTGHKKGSVVITVEQHN